MRPVSLRCMVFDLSKHIGEILKNIVSTNCDRKNSFELMDKLQNITLDKEVILVSFDAISLFANIPIHIAIKNITREWETIKPHTKINRSKFLTILYFCLKDNNFFKFNENFYQQTFMMPMGNLHYCRHNIGQNLYLNMLMIFSQ